jgi:NAD(P)-dependent dehydrogenase (short-subunit alcohol dehydrogenase family)
MTQATTSRPLVLITGAAKRLGRAMALDLAKNGWNVAIHYRSSDADAQQTVKDLQALGAQADCFKADLSIEAECRDLLPAVIQKMGRLDALVNNASLFEWDSAQTFTYECMDKHARSNTAAPIMLAQALHAHVSERMGRGVVVNMLDQKLWNMNPDFLSYTLSKAALRAANTALAKALAPQCRVVGVAPGLTLTSHMLSQEAFETLHRMAPLGHSSSASDVAHAVRFALENPAITGTELLVDGGQHLMQFDRDFSLMSPSQDEGV